MKRTKVILFFSILIILVGYASYKLVSTSVQYERMRLFENPDPIPWYFDAVWPEPGSALSLDEFQKYVMGGPCFEVSSDGLLGLSFEDSDSFERMSLLVNGYQPANYPAKGPKGGPTVWTVDNVKLICWSVPFTPGEYLIEIKIEGIITEEYAWAFRINE